MKVAVLFALIFIAALSAQSCTLDTDCILVDMAKCDVGSSTCVPCDTDSHCAHFPNEPVCDSGVCVCTSTDGCLDSNYPFCALDTLGNPICSECVFESNNDLCLQNYVDMGACTEDNSCFLCSQDTDCINPDFPVCLVAGGCAECQETGPGGRKDSVCVDNSPICVNYACTPCVMDAQCEAYRSTTPRCIVDINDADVGSCVECLDGALDCTATGLTGNCVNNVCEIQPSTLPPVSTSPPPIFDPKKKIKPTKKPKTEKTAKTLKQKPTKPPKPSKKAKLARVGHPQ